MQTSTRIAQFIETELLGGERAISEDQALFSSRLLDSFHLVELLLFIEGSFKVKIGPGDISQEAIDTPAALARLVEAKLGGGSRA
jgi:acyl carrier protein